MKTAVVLLTDSVLLSEGMARLMENSPHFELVASAGTLERAQECLSRAKAQLIVIEPHLLDAVQRQDIRHCFALAGRNKKMAFVALVCRYVEQSVLQQFDGIVEVTDSRKRIDTVLQEAVQKAQSDDNPTDGGELDLSDRERDVLIAVAHGLANKEIADSLNISIHTVISHRRNIVAKTGIKSVAGLTVYALMNGLIEEGEIF